MFSCPKCANRVKVSRRHAGKSGSCPQCKQKIKVPSLEQSLEILPSDDAFADGEAPAAEAGLNKDLNREYMRILAERGLVTQEQLAWVVSAMEEHEASGGETDASALVMLVMHEVLEQAQADEVHAEAMGALTQKAFERGAQARRAAVATESDEQEAEDLSEARTAELKQHEAEEEEEEEEEIDEGAYPTLPHAVAEPAAPARETKECPLCGEEILAVAKKCRFCGEFLTKGGRRPRRRPPKRKRKPGAASREGEPRRKSKNRLDRPEAVSWAATGLLMLVVIYLFGAFNYLIMSGPPPARGAIGGMNVALFVMSVAAWIGVMSGRKYGEILAYVVGFPACLVPSVVFLVLLQRTDARRYQEATSLCAECEKSTPGFQGFFSELFCPGCAHVCRVETASPGGKIGRIVALVFFGLFMLFACAGAKIKSDQYAKALRLRTTYVKLQLEYEADLAGGAVARVGGDARLAEARYSMRKTVEQSTLLLQQVRRGRSYGNLLRDKLERLDQQEKLLLRIESRVLEDHFDGLERRLSVLELRLRTAGIPVAPQHRDSTTRLAEARRALHAESLRMTGTTKLLEEMRRR